MKFQVTMKTPDCLDVIEREVWDECDKSDEEAKERCFELEQKCKDLCKRFFLYSEILTVEFDTDKQTATVLPS